MVALVLIAWSAINNVVIGASRPSVSLPDARGDRIVPMQFFKDLSLSTAVAGFVAVLVGFTSSVAIVFQAAQAFGATPAQITSWMWALGLGMGLCSLVPSLILRQPVMVAWSTPGAAVLATAGLAMAMRPSSSRPSSASGVAFRIAAVRCSAWRSASSWPCRASDARSSATDST